MLKNIEEKEKSKNKTKQKKVYKWGGKATNEEEEKGTRKERVRVEQKWGKGTKRTYSLSSKNYSIAVVLAVNKKKKLENNLKSLNKDKKQLRSEKKVREIHAFVLFVHFLLCFSFVKTPLTEAILFCWCSWRKIFASQKRKKREWL